MCERAREMEQAVVDSPVVLVIKAPDQKYDDQTISCFLNWTVEKLKSHLSNVYPSKPVSEHLPEGKKNRNVLVFGEYLR